MAERTNRRNNPWAAIPAIYELAGAPDDGMSLIVEQLGGALGFRGILTAALDGPAALSAPIAQPRFAARAERLLEAYAAGGYVNDPTPAHLIAGYRRGERRGLVWSGDFTEAEAAEHMRWHSSLLASTEWITDWRRTDQGAMIAMVLHQTADRPLTPAEVVAFRGLCDHLLAAEQWLGHLATQEADRCSEPVMIVEADQRLHHANPAAERMLGEDDTFRVRGDRLGVREVAAAIRLRAAVVEACAPTGGGGERFIAIPRTLGGLPHLLGVRSTRLPPDAIGSSVLAARLRIVDRDAGPPAEALARYRDLFGLTETEARVAAAMMARDGSLREVALQLGMGYNTARTHVARLLDKTGTSTQTGLVRLFARLE